jgi:hypothetical protein
MSAAGDMFIPWFVAGGMLLIAVVSVYVLWCAYQENANS